MNFKKISKDIIIRTPIKSFAKKILAKSKRKFLSLQYIFGKSKRNFSSSQYWKNRYMSGDTSGSGSYGALATFKADILNKFVKENRIHSVIEFGMGDGNQLSIANYPSYIGVDISETAVELCKKAFVNDTTKHFIHSDLYQKEQADLSLSLDVIYHLIEDSIFEQYMQRLFNAAERFVIIYSTNSNQKYRTPHIKHRKFTDWIDQKITAFHFVEHISNRLSNADFYIYQRNT